VIESRGLQVRLTYATLAPRVSAYVTGDMSLGSLVRLALLRVEPKPVYVGGSSLYQLLTLLPRCRFITELLCAVGSITPGILTDSTVQPGKLFRRSTQRFITVFRTARHWKSIPSYMYR